MQVHLVGVSGGRLWRTIRRSQAQRWDPWDEVLARAGLLTGATWWVSCAVVSGDSDDDLCRCAGGDIVSVREAYG